MNLSRTTQYKPALLALAVALATHQVQASEADPVASAINQTMEEVVVQGRLRSSAEALVNERMEEEVVADLLGAEMIGRLGDSTVASALRRVSGLTLVNNKFIYVRGLGERYSSSTLNGATIPSPDLTRNVIPLDIFPTSIVESLAVQKSYSADKAATFGGGSVDIRTKGIPDDFTYSIEVGAGQNSRSGSTALSYAGGGDDDLGTDDGTRALPALLTDSIQRFRGELDSQTILATLRAEGQENVTTSDALLINRQLALSLKRDLSIRQESIDPDWNIKANIGNNFYITDDLEAGFMVAGAYQTEWRDTNTIARSFGFPDERFETEQESTRSININGSLNLGLRYTDDHKLSTTSLYLRNTDDETAIINLFNENSERSSGRGFLTQRVKFEERDMVVNQVSGEHYLGAATRELLGGWLPKFIAEQTRFDWNYSDARARTHIPSEVEVSSSTTNDPVTGEILESRLDLNRGAVDYRFTELKDDLENGRWQVTVPFETGSSRIELSGGGESVRKLRTYRQTQFSLGPTRANGAAVLRGSIGEVLADANILDAANGFELSLTGGNNQSYIAATMTDSAFGKIDWTYDETWRVAAGARYEDYRQVALDWNIYSFSVESPQITNDPDELRNATFKEDKWYPSVSLTYMDDWLADVFQLRFGWSRTVVRPDLRELTDASYVDARTGFLTDGNPNALPADFTNYDIRAEWFLDNSDTVTVTLYRKEIDNPIEFFERAASDTNRSREIINAASGEINGIEFEALKSLGEYGDVFEPFFIQGNVTLQDTELVAGARADAPTNPVRDLSGASEYVVNLLLGFDSPGGQHAATLVYNVFGERLFVAGRNGAPDGYEQPFHSLDLTYSWYPAENIIVKAKLQNLLDESIIIETAGVETFEEKPGSAISLSFNWTL